MRGIVVLLALTLTGVAGGRVPDEPTVTVPAPAEEISPTGNPASRAFTPTASPLSSLAWTEPAGRRGHSPPPRVARPDADEARRFGPRGPRGVRELERAQHLSDLALLRAGSIAFRVGTPPPFALI